MPDIVTFDGPNKLIIEIDAAGDNELDLVEIYSEWKTWVLLSDNAKYLQAFSVVGGDEITATQNLGSTFFLENGWRLRPAESSHKLTIVGNLFTRESGQSVFIPTVGAFTVNTETRVSSLVDSSVSRLDLTQLLPAVYIDVDNGVPGTDEGIGVPTNPVNNIADARTIANRDGLRKYFVLGAIVLDQAHDRWSFEGTAAERATEIDMNGWSVDKSAFKNLRLTGQMLGAIDCSECGLQVFSEISGQFRECGFLSNFSLKAGTNSNFSDCFSEVAGTGSPVCVFGANATASFRNYSGGLRISSMAAGAIASVDLDPGKVYIDASCSGGELLIRGVGTLTDEASGAVMVTDGGFIDSVTINTTADHTKATNARVQSLP
jgi:hypothetical protein